MEEQALQILIAKISALSALAGSIIGALATITSVWLNKKIQESGKVKVFCRFVASKGDGKEFGIYNAGDGSGLIMRVPMWIELCNTSGISRYIRDINIVAFKDGKEISEFTQFQGQNIGKENELSYGNNQAYTLVVEANNTMRFNVEFSLKESDIENIQIDTLKMRYYDEKNKCHFKELYKISDNPVWSIRKFEIKKQWIEVSGRK